MRRRLSNGFAIFGGLAVLIMNLLLHDFRPMTLRRQVSLGLLFFRVRLLSRKVFSISIQDFPTYSYANTSRMVSRAAFRAGKMLAIADKASTSPSQIAYPVYVNTTSIGDWNNARLTIVDSK